MKSRPIGHRILGLVGSLAIVATGCGGSDDAATTSTNPPTATTVTPTTTTAPPTTTTAVTPTTTTTLPPEPARYQLVVDNTWSEETQGGSIPGIAHFSWLAGATHDDSTSIWSVGELASPGVTEMAETGRTNILLEEIDGADGIDFPLSWQWWFCAATTSAVRTWPDSPDRRYNCGETVLEFDIDPAYPFVTLASMIGPTPDWFIGVDSLALLEDGRWRDEVVVFLTPYDGGTRTEQEQFSLKGPQNDPPEPISLITSDSGQIVGPEPIGSFTFTRLLSGCSDQGPVSFSGESP